MSKSPISLEPYWQANLSSFAQDQTGLAIWGWLNSAGLIDSRVSELACFKAIEHCMFALGDGWDHRLSELTLARYLCCLYIFSHIA